MKPLVSLCYGANVMQMCKNLPDRWIRPSHHHSHRGCVFFKFHCHSIDTKGRVDTEIPFTHLHLNHKKLQHCPTNTGPSLICALVHEQQTIATQEYRRQAGKLSLISRPRVILSTPSDLAGSRTGRLTDGWI